VAINANNDGLLTINYRLEMFLIF